MTGSANVLQVLATFAVLSSIGMAANLRVLSLVNALAFQSLLTGVSAVVVGWQADSRELLVVGGLVLGLKAALVPGALRTAVKRGRAALPRDTEPSLSLPTSVMICALLAVLGYAAGRPIVAASALATRDLLPAGLTLALTGTFLMIVRGTAMTQAVGLMVVGNGVLMIAIAATPVFSALPELGLAFEALVSAIVYGMQAFGIQRRFDQMDRARLGGRPWMRG